MQTIRERILQNVLTGTAIFGFIALVATIPPRLLEKQYFLIGIFALAFIVLLAVTFIRTIPYRIRAVVFLGLLSLVGLSTLFSDGLYGNGRLFLMGLPLLTVILLGSRPGLVALGINLGSIAAAGLMMLTGVLAPPVFVPGEVNASWQFWLLAIATATLISTVSVVSLIAMFRGFQNTIDSEQKLRVELNSERSALEGRVQERTRDLERRLVQIRTAADISLALNNQLDPEKVLQQVVDLVQKRFDLYYVGVFLVDDRQENAVLRAGSGEAGMRMLERGHHLALNGNSMIAWSISNRKARIALDVGKEAVRFNNPDLPLTRSEMALPILIPGKVIEPGETPALDLAMGAMTVQSIQSTAFDNDDITVLTSIANSLATALQNANLFKQVEFSLEEIRVLNRQYLQQAWSTQTESGLVVVSEDEIAKGKMAMQALEAGLDETQTKGSEVNWPLTLRDQVIGQLSILLDPTSHTNLPDQDAAAVAAPGLAGQLSAEDKAFIDAIAVQTSLALENVRLVEETQRRASYDRLLTSITRTARSETDIDAILRSTVKELGAALHVSEAVIQLSLNPDEGKQI